MGPWIRFWFKGFKDHWSTCFNWLLCIYNFILFNRQKYFLIMHISTKKWLFTKISSLILLPLMVWFIVNFVSIYDENYSEVALFFTQQPSKIIFSIFIIFAFFFSALTISEIFEDYIQDEKIKNVANKLLNIFAIIIPLITILGIFNLTLWVLIK